MGRSIYTIEDINSELDFAPNAFVALDYSGAPTEFQLEQEITADLHTNQFQEIGCHICGNVDMFTREINNKGRRYRCGYCLYNSESEFETVKSQKDITLSSFGLDYVCDICGEIMDSYNRGTIIKHIQKHEEANKSFEAEGQESEAHSILNWITQPLIVATPEPEPMDCVSCNSDEISAGPVEPAGVGTLVRSVDCESCGCRWEETFNYVSHEIEREGVSNLSKWSKQPYGSFASETTDSEIRQWLKVLRDTDPDWEEIDWEKPSDKPDPDWGLEWEAERRIVKGMRKCDICSMPARNGEELCPNCWTEYLSATYANTHWTEHQHQEAIAILNWMSKPADKPKPTELNWSCPHCKSSKVMHDYDNVPIKHTDEIAITRQYSCQDCNGEWVETWLYDSLKKLNGD